MAKYYPYVIVALLLIYSHWINASWLQRDLDVVWRGLKEEGPDWRKKLFGVSRNDLFWLIDSISGLRNNAERRALCFEVMKHLIADEKKDEFVAFIKKPSDIPWPRMVSTWMPLICSNRKIDRYDYYKPMFWCKPRRYQKKVNGHTVEDQIRGFYVAGSTKNDHKVFVLRPPSIDAKVVVPIGQLNGYQYKRLRCPRSSSSSPPPSPGRLGRFVRPGTPSPESSPPRPGVPPGRGGALPGRGGAPPGRGGAPFGQGGAAWGQGGSQWGQGGPQWGQGGQQWGQGGAPWMRGGASWGRGAPSLGQGAPSLGQGDAPGGQSTSSSAETSSTESSSAGSSSSASSSSS